LKKALPMFDGGFHVAGFTGNGIGFVFRDAHGIRPSYYYVDDEVVVAASERAAIRTTFNVAENEVKELMPGTALIVNENGEIDIAQILEPKERKACRHCEHRQRQKRREFSGVDQKGHADPPEAGEKEAEAETAIAPSVTAGEPAAVKPGAAQSADSISSDKKDVAKQMERKEELSKSFDVAQPEQKAKSFSAGDDNANRNALASRSNNFSNTFIGNVRNQSNQPVANTFVQIPNLNVATKTDKKGYFSFEAPDTALSVSIAADGFETQNLSLRNKAMLNQITLKPVQNVLREVVVQSNGAEKKKQSVSNDISIKILDAEPVNGWTEYNAYLEKNKKVSSENKNIHGTVIISFEVHGKWINNFTIVQSLDEDLDAEAIRLIKEGPAWKLLKGKKAVATVTVRF